LVSNSVCHSGSAVLGGVVTLTVAHSSGRDRVTLAALCDILGATPNDLIEVRAVNVQVAKAAGGARPAPSARRTVVRRPGAS
jgi:hypothetical protein